MAKIIAMEFKSDTDGKQSLTVQAEIGDGEDKDLAFEEIKQWTSEKLPVVKGEEKEEVVDDKLNVNSWGETTLKNDDFVSKLTTGDSNLEPIIITPDIAKDLIAMVQDYKKNKETVSETTENNQVVNE